MSIRQGSGFVVFVKNKYVRPAAVRRLPSVGIVKCFGGRLHRLRMVPTVKKSTVGSPYRSVNKFFYWSRGRRSLVPIRQGSGFVVFE